MERWYRKKTKQEVLSLRRKISFFYAFIGWNTFAIIFYAFMKKEMPEDPDERSKCRFCGWWFRILLTNIYFSGAAYGRLIVSPSNMHVYQVSGLTLTNDFDIKMKKAEVTQIEKENSDSASAKTDEH